MTDASAEDRLDSYGVVLEDMKGLFSEESEQQANSPFGDQRRLSNAFASAAATAAASGSPAPVAAPSSPQSLIARTASSLMTRKSSLSQPVTTASKSQPPAFLTDTELLAKAITLCRSAKTGDDGDEMLQQQENDGEVSMLALRCALANFGLAEDPFNPMCMSEAVTGMVTPGALSPRSGADIQEDDSPIRHAERYSHIPQLLLDPLLYATLTVEELKELLAGAASTYASDTSAAAAADGNGDSDDEARDAATAMDVMDTLAGLTTTIQLLRTDMKFKPVRSSNIAGGSQQATFTAEDDDEDEAGVAMIENPMTGQLEPISTESTDHPLLRKMDPPSDIGLAKRLVKLARVEQDLFMTARRRQDVNTLGRILHGSAFTTENAVVVDDGNAEHTTEEDEEIYDADETLAQPEDAEDATNEHEDEPVDLFAFSAAEHRDDDVEGELFSIAVVPPVEVDGGASVAHLASAEPSTSKSAAGGEEVTVLSDISPPMQPRSLMVSIRSADSQLSDSQPTPALRPSMMPSNDPTPRAGSMMPSPRFDAPGALSSKQPTPRLKFVLPEETNPVSGGRAARATFIVPDDHNDNTNSLAGGISGGLGSSASLKSGHQSGENPPAPLSRRRSIALTADDSATGAAKRRQGGAHGDNASSASGLSKKLHPLLHRLRTVLLRRLQKQRARLTECGFALSCGAVLHTGITPTTDSLQQTASGRFASVFSLEDEDVDGDLEDGVLHLSNRDRVAKRNAHLTAMDKQKQQQLAAQHAAERHQMKLVDDKFRACDMSIDEFFFVPQMKKRSEMLPFFLRKSFGPQVQATRMRSAIKSRDDAETSLSSAGYLFLKKGEGRTSTTQMEEDATRQKAHTAAMIARRQKLAEEELALLGKLPISPGIFPVVDIGEQPYRTPQPYRTAVTKHVTRAPAQYHAKKRLVHSFIDVDVAAPERAKNFEPPKWASRLYEAAATSQRLEARQRMITGSRGPAATINKSNRPSSAASNRSASHNSAPISFSRSASGSAGPRIDSSSPPLAPSRGTSRPSPSPQPIHISTPERTTRVFPSSSSPQIPTLSIGQSSNGSNKGATPLSSPPLENLVSIDLHYSKADTDSDGKSGAFCSSGPKERTSLAVARGVDYLRMRRQMRHMMSEPHHEMHAAAHSKSAVNLSLASDPDKSVVVNVAGVGHVLETSWFHKNKANVLKHAVCKALRDAGGPTYLS